MKVISENDETYVCSVGMPLESFRLKKVFLWRCETNDQSIQKFFPEKTWLEYERYILTRFPKQVSKVIKIDTRRDCTCDICSNKTDKEK